MKEEEEDSIDHKFKEGLSKAEDNIAFRNDDWDAMEKLLDEHKRRKGVIFYLPRIISGVAALLLLTLGFFFLRPANKPAVTKNDVVKAKPSATNTNAIDGTKVNPANNKGADSGINNKPLNNAATNSSPKLANNNTKPIDKKSTYANQSNINNGNSSVKSGLINQQSAAIISNRLAALSGNRNSKKAGEDLGTTNGNRIAGDHTSNPAALSGSSNRTDMNNSASEVLAAAGTGVVDNNTVLTATDLSTSDKQLDNSSKRYAAAIKQKQKAKAGANALWPGNALVLSVLTAPDVNGVGSSFSRAQVGSTTGLMLSMGLGHRFTVSTGALYAKKPYSASFSKYNTNYPFKINPTDVYADCRVLDIPINIDYRLYSKGRNMVAVGTGISSYFMLRENYRFDYNTPGASGPATYNISNQNQHILGVLNINATYQRRINEKFGLNIQPYMKLPLTNIGYGRVDLQSTGVAVGVSWYLTSNRPN